MYRKALVRIIGVALWIGMACALVHVCVIACSLFEIIGSVFVLSIVEVIFAFVMVAPWFIMSVFWMLLLRRAIVGLSGEASLVGPGFFAVFSIVFFAFIFLIYAAAVYDS